MNDWNPNKEDVLYFHLTGGPTGNERNSYIKVDTINYKVISVHLRENGKTRCNIRGIYELKWITWLSGYTHWLKYDYRKLKGVFAPPNAGSYFAFDPGKRVMLNRTTENQFLQAINRYLKSIL